METRSPEHMSMIAGIIYNRLEQGMQLQMDSTREYINDYVTGNPLLGNTSKYAELYNTYKCAALPAGPIAVREQMQSMQQKSNSDRLFIFLLCNDNETIIRPHTKNIRLQWRNSVYNTENPQNDKKMPFGIFFILQKLGMYHTTKEYI